MLDFKGFLCLALALCLIFILAVPCFADPVTLSGAEFFMSLWGTYASQHGLGMIFSDNGVPSSVQNPFSVQAYRNAGAQLVEDFLDYSNSIYSDAEEMYDAFKDEVTVTQDLNNQVIMHWSDTLTEWYDQFANWLLGEEYGLTATESGFTHSSGSFDSPLSSSTSGWPVYSSGMSNSQIFAIGNIYGNGSSSVYKGAVGDSSVLLFALLVNSNYYPAVVSGVDNRYAYVGNGSSYDTFIHAYSPISSNGKSLSYGRDVSLYFSLNQLAPNVLIFNSFQDAADYYVEHYPDSIVTSTEVIQLRPKDKYNEDPTANPIPVPDTSDAGYLPAPQDYVLNPSYVGSLPADIAALINSLTDALVENVDPLVAEGDDPAPPSMTPVELPFLGFTLPSFNLGLSSIWHYVIDWVGSLGSGISFFASVWSNIPYAMVIPIYATAVVVIVLGMFKRFLL